MLHDCQDSSPVLGIANLTKVILVSDHVIINGQYLFGTKIFRTIYSTTISHHCFHRHIYITQTHTYTLTLHGRLNWTDYIFRLLGQNCCRIPEAVRIYVQKYAKSKISSSWKATNSNVWFDWMAADLQRIHQNTMYIYIINNHLTFTWEIANTVGIVFTQKTSSHQFLGKAKTDLDHKHLISIPCHI